MKDLIINNRSYAKYDIAGSFLYLKILILEPGIGNKEAYENYLISIIEMVEQKTFTMVGYLNIENYEKKNLTN